MALMGAGAGEIAVAMKKNWGWLLGLGILAIIGGVVALGSTVLASAAVVWLLGILVLVMAVLQVVNGFQRKGWWLILGLVLGGLYAFNGVWMLAEPLQAAVALTLFLSVWFLVFGAIRVIAAIVTRSTGWVWELFSGLIEFALGWMLIANWPVTGTFAIGLFVGIDLVIVGTTWVIAAFAARNLPDSPGSPSMGAAATA